MGIKILIFLIISHFFLLPLCAGEYNAVRKLGRGFANLATGWIETIHQPIITKEQGSGISGEVNGFFYGSLKGFAYFIGRTVVGAYEIVTFPLPPYKPVIEPEYIFPANEEMKKSAMEQMYDIKPESSQSSQ